MPSSEERPPLHQRPVHFGPFRFDPQSGEIERRGEEEVRATRLSPQPARLLDHLIRRRPELVSGEEIRELLWPDTQVEFEQSLHTCIRQIRAALGDSASAPRYIETIPRRGYRFLAEAEDGGDRAVSPSRDERPHENEPRSPSPRRRIGVGLGAAAALVLVLLVLRAVAGSATTPVRVAVMPFEPLTNQSLLQPNNDLAETIVALLVAVREPTLEVIGPSTTEIYDGRPARLRDLFHEHRVDYVVNGRQTGGEAPPRILIEIIRADGAHVWVRYLDELQPGDALAETVARAAAAAASETAGNAGSD